MPINTKAMKKNDIKTIAVLLLFTLGIVAASQAQRPARGKGIIIPPPPKNAPAISPR